MSLYIFFYQSNQFYKNNSDTFYSHFTIFMFFILLGRKLLMKSECNEMIFLNEKTQKLRICAFSFCFCIKRV